MVFLGKQRLLEEFTIIKPKLFTAPEPALKALVQIRLRPTIRTNLMDLHTSHRRLPVL